MDERYRTFFQRFAASLIDGALLSVLSTPTTILVGYGPATVAAAWLILTTPAFWAYSAYCHGRWGKTLGKHVLGIQVVRADTEGPIGYGRAILRDSGSIVLGALGTALLLHLVWSGDTEAFRMFDQSSFARYDENEAPSLGQVFRDAVPNWQMLVVTVLSWMWSLAEFVTMMTNSRRRAIHDFIGGTVVVKTGSATSTAPAGARKTAEFDDRSHGW